MYNKSYSDPRYSDSIRRKKRLNSNNQSESKILELFIKQIIVALIIFFCIYILMLMKTDYSKKAVKYVKSSIHQNININYEKKHLTDSFNEILNSLKGKRAAK